MVQVVILLTEQLSLFELACATELFALPRDEFDDWYKTRIVSLSKVHYKSLCNISLNCERVDEIPPCDLLVIPSYPTVEDEIPETLRDQITTHHLEGGRTISFCSGAFLLAATGLLDSRIATTHWRYADKFKQQFPSLQYKDDILYSYDGKVGCSAGSAAGIDLGIEVIRQDFGYSAANIVARRLVLPAHRNGGQKQFIEKPLEFKSSTVSRALDWAMENLSPDLTIDQIAAKANMTRRTFDRQFKRQHKITPLTWLTNRKLEVARKLLETSEHSVEKIALLAGYESVITLRHNFRKAIALTPSEYRLRFRQ